MKTMVETRRQKRKREDSEATERYSNMLKEAQDEDRCNNCGTSLIKDIIVINNLELKEKVYWEYDMKPNEVLYEKNTLIITTGDPDYADQEWCLNCGHNWVIAESEETFLHDLSLEKKQNVIDMDN